MGIEQVLALPQTSPMSAHMSIDYDKWAERTVEGGQVFVHYGGRPVPPSAFNGDLHGEKGVLHSYESYHVSRGYAGIAYDWAIGQSGTLYRLRGKARSAATSGDVDFDGVFNNVEGDGVLFLVGEGQEPSAKALDMGVRVLDAFGRDVFTHREARGTITACAGEHLQRWVQRYRNGSLKMDKERREVAVTAHRWPDLLFAEMVANAHSFAFVTPSGDGWKQIYPDGQEMYVDEVGYLVAIGYRADVLVRRNGGKGVAITEPNGDLTRLRTIEMIRETVDRRRPW